MANENINVDFSITGIESAIKRLEQFIDSLKKVPSAAQVAQKALDDLTRAQNRLVGAQKALRGAITSSSLSFLFFGLSVQRVAGRITRSALGAFTELNEGATRNAQLLSSLAAAFKFLGFVVGDAIATALAPFIPTIIDIVEAVADWIERNPQLTTGIIAVAGAVGGLISTLAALALPLSSVRGLLDAFREVKDAELDVSNMQQAIIDLAAAVDGMEGAAEELKDAVDDMAEAGNGAGAIFIPLGDTFAKIALGAGILLAAFIAYPDVTKKVFTPFKRLGQVLDDFFVQLGTSLGITTRSGEGFEVFFSIVSTGVEIFGELLSLVIDLASGIISIGNAFGASIGKIINAGSNLLGAGDLFDSEKIENTLKEAERFGRAFEERNPEGVFGAAKQVFEFPQTVQDNFDLIKEQASVTERAAEATGSLDEKFRLLSEGAVAKVGPLFEGIVNSLIKDGGFNDSLEGSAEILERVAKTELTIFEGKIIDSTGELINHASQLRDNASAANQFADALARINREKRERAEL